MTTLYHVTSADSVERILRYGIHPKVGANSALVHEKNGLVCLTDRDSFPYWAVLLGRDSVLRVDVTGLEPALHRRKASPFAEYVTTSYISPRRVREIPMVRPDHKGMTQLRQYYMVNYVNAIVNVVVKSYEPLADEGLSLPAKEQRALHEKFTRVFTMIDRLQFEALSPNELSACVDKVKADGEPFFTEKTWYGYSRYESMLYLSQFDDDVFADAEKLVEWLDHFLREQEKRRA